jgi:hypothetical protein
MEFIPEQKDNGGQPKIFLSTEAILLSIRHGPFAPFHFHVDHFSSSSLHVGSRPNENRQTSITRRH